MVVDEFEVSFGQAVYKEYYIYDKAGNVKTIKRTFTNYGMEYPDSDHPDDNYSSANPFFSGTNLPQGACFDTAVGILMKGFYAKASMLVEKAGEETELVFTDFDPWDTYEQYPVMIIPSGALYGMENADSFRARLEEYTKLGGKLIVFSQSSMAMSIVYYQVERYRNMDGSRICHVLVLLFIYLTGTRFYLDLIQLI